MFEGDGTEHGRRVSYRRSASPSPTKVSLLTDRLLLKANSDLAAPTAVKSATFMMGNVFKGGRSTGPTTQHKLKVQLQLPHSNETLTASTSTPGTPNGKKKDKEQRKSPKTAKASKSVKISNTVSIQNGDMPTKPPRTTKKTSSKAQLPISIQRHSSCLTSPPPPTTPTTSRPVSPKPSPSSKEKSPTPSKIGFMSAKKSPPIAKALKEGFAKMKGVARSKQKSEKSQSQSQTIEGSSQSSQIKADKGQGTTPAKFTVTHRPLAPPAEYVPKKRAQLTRESDLSTSLPTLTPYLSETKRVSDSVFLRTRSPSPLPRQTKTSMMRRIIGSCDPVTAAEIDFKDSKFRSSSSINESLSTAMTKAELELKPRQRRRRSVSCLNLRDYQSYVMALRSSHTQKSPRFSRLHKLYSSLERLSELERSTTSLYDHTVLSSSKKHDFDAWWKVRNRMRIDEEIDALSQELLQAQKDREFFFRPKTPTTWTPDGDAHFRFKKWSVDELKSFLVEDDHKPRNRWRLDLYKTQWRGVTVKELALNMEVNELYKQQGLGIGTGERHGERLLRRAFSMSSTLSEEQREGIKKRIVHLITEARKGGSGIRKNRHGFGGRAAVTTPMGFTLSSDPKKSEDFQPTTPGSGMSETKKKEISHKISEELRERRVKDRVRGDTLPLSTKIALKKSESFSTSRRPNAPFYSVYCKNDVNNRIKVFEQQTGPESHDKSSKPRIVQAVAPTPNNVTRGRAFIRTISPIGASKVGDISGTGPSSLPPFRSLSPPLRSPSPQRRSVSPIRAAPLPKEYVSHINIISKLAALLLKRNTQLRKLVTREVLERDRLDRLRYLNCGEVERLRDFFEEKQSLEELRDFAFNPEINLLRCLFCSDSNLAKITEKLDPDHKRRCASAGGDVLPESKRTAGAKRAAPDGSSPTPMSAMKGSSNTLRPDFFLSTRSRRPIYQPSSVPNYCQPTLTAHYTSDSLERLDSPDLFEHPGGYDSLPASYSSSPTAPPPRRILDDRLRLSYTNYDPAAHTPRYRYIPQPPIIPTVKRSGSSLSYINPGTGGASFRRAESFHHGRRERVFSPPYQGHVGYPHTVYTSVAPVTKPPRKGVVAVMTRTTTINKSSVARIIPKLKPQETAV